MALCQGLSGSISPTHLEGSIMASPAGHVLVRGQIQSMGTRDVPERAAAAAYRDGEDKWHAEVTYRAAYVVHEVAVLTMPLGGGFITVLVKDEDIPATVLRALIEDGEEVEWVVRPYASRERGSFGWFNRVNLYFVRLAANLSTANREAFASAL